MAVSVVGTTLKTFRGAEKIWQLASNCGVPPVPRERCFRKHYTLYIRLRGGKGAFFGLFPAASKRCTDCITTRGSKSSLDTFLPLLRDIFSPVEKNDKENGKKLCRAAFSAAPSHPGKRLSWISYHGTKSLGKSSAVFSPSLSRTLF